MHKLIARTNVLIVEDNEKTPKPLWPRSMLYIAPISPRKLAPLVSAPWFWVVYLVQVSNLSGAAGDLYVTSLMLKMLIWLLAAPSCRRMAHRTSMSR